jgi:hypothetical protein
MPFSGFAW